MSPFLQFILALGLLIGAARLGGLASKRLGQPAVLGELLVGVLLGPTLLDFFRLTWFSDEHLGEQIHHLADLGVILLMFLAGLEIELDEMLKTGRAALTAGLLGVLVPVGLGSGVALLFDYPVVLALFMGVVLSATSVSISAQTLIELRVLRSREGLALLGAAVFDDILVILVLSIFLALGGGGAGGPGQVVIVLARMAAYLAGAVLLGFWLVPRLLDWIHRLPISYGLVSFGIVLVLLFAWSAEVLGGIAAITGAFLVGVAMARSSLRQEIEHSFTTLTYGFFVPLFFVNIGLQADARQVSGRALVFGLALILVAIVSKILGSGLGAWWGGLQRGEALRLGIGMVSRGEVGLIVASVGLRQGLIDTVVFADIVLVVLATTLLTPLMLRWAYSRARRSAGTRTPAEPVAAPPPGHRPKANEGEKP
ncbi:MAG: cation:proton antiporter [Anaerolineales bacterium]|nr:cation:proton antiporter [Anaerolineales bacterium]